MMLKHTPAIQVSDDDKLRILQQPGKTHQRQFAELAIGGVAQNAMTMRAFAETGLGKLSITDCCNALEDLGDAANAGDLKSAERMLLAQASALNAIFGEMARRAGANMGVHTQAAEMYMRLAFKAQSQCRTTIETLSEMKNPRVVFARQANISNGPQQVNNGVPAQAGTKGSLPNELLKDMTHAGNGMDAGAACTTGRADQELAAVGAIDRAAKRRRQKRVGA